MLSAPHYQSTDLGNGCWGTGELQQGSEGVWCFAGSECVLCEIVYVTIARAACEASSATWNLDSNSAFALGPRKIPENLDRVGRSQDWLLASSPVLNTRVLTLVPICAVSSFLPLFLFSPFKNIYNLFLQKFYLYIIWISTKRCTITPAEGMNSYIHKYVNNYTYICNSDSLIIGTFRSSLYFVKEIGCYTRFVAHSIIKIMFHSSILLFFLPSHLPT
jgi:hypothetical protein